MKLKYSWQIFEEYTKAKFHENLPKEPRCSKQMNGQIDRHDEINLLFTILQMHLKRKDNKQQWPANTVSLHQTPPH